MSDLPGTSVPAPIYRRIKSHIADRIRRGAWPAGLKIPSENQLVAELHVSRMTINRALRELTDEGYLSRVQGVGTFVRGNPGRASLIELRNVAEEIRDRGHEHRAILEAKDSVRATADLVERFEMPRPAPLFRVLIVHCEDELPLQIEEFWCNPRAAPRFLEQDFASESPSEYLIRTAPVDEVEHVVRAVLPDVTQQRQLIVHQDEPCLLVERRIWSQGLVASCTNLLSPGSRHELRTRIANTPTGRPSTSTERNHQV
ncbi:GntR family histidine utilization transcriptional repressor [Rhodoligotrophos appendicifer]|uniref:histidine utilization repressor n=1 Tax=Rhodoligotrophos appendicifer TaxID=987056 RepID=UPI0014788769|nr:histidine utilization repressor [Rhodoligotrophos appendicifer]